MANPSERQAAEPQAADAPQPAELEQAAELLGGARILRRLPRDPLAVHDMLRQGLPGQALSHLIGSLVRLRATPALEKAIGMSLRTLQRRKVAPAEPLSQEQSGRAWTFAENLAKATAVFGSQLEAEEWLERPAMGLNQRRPIDLLATAAGAKLVNDFLERLRYGVYT